ncbi:MAG: DUF4336 domain-containing protein [Proteobacteria bacterium]|nr:DUF4336 domain-containing protein [Pseudomonadota bacterium]
MDDPAEYPPLNTVKPLAEDLWIVDGETIRFGPPGLKLPFPTRMTLARLPDGGLFVHSPTPLTPALKAQVDALGEVRWLIGPNRIHYWWLPEWHAAYSRAPVYVAPRLREQARSHIDFDTIELAGSAVLPWSNAIDSLGVPGRYMSEYVFFHRASRTLILTDFIENFEAAKLSSPFLRWLIRVAGGDGSMPRDMRLTYPRQEVRRAVETMIGWNPERIVVAHGAIYPSGAVEALRRAFAWVLR